MIQPSSPPPRKSLAREAVELLTTLAVGMVIAGSIHAVLFQPFTIPSSSMEPGLVTGDYVVTSKFPYGWSRASLAFNPPLPGGRLFGRDPARGDVVVFRLPRDPQQIWVKRVIGLPGDRVRVEGGVVFVNDRALPQVALGEVADQDMPERRVMLARETLPNGRVHEIYDGGPGLPGDDTRTQVVPDGHYLMMGDNRDNSLDSRWPAATGVGLLPAENVVGRAELIVASWKPGASLFKPWTWLDLQPGRFLKWVR
ncbi:signal peptidase I [Brevundimonas sp. NPDC092305]|uniref:signal peptidase I n=1 Tax=Brevundimonas sp. NPDC092305 TaxID=3363957 RepID=UPI003826FA94